MKCPICGMTFKSTRRHLQKYHRIKFSSENSAKLYLRLYKIFKKRHLSLPLKHPEKMVPMEILEVMENMAKVFRRPSIAVNLFLLYAKALARRHPNLVLDDFPNMAKTSNRIKKTLSILTLSLVNSSKVIPILMDLCDRRTIILLKYVANTFRKFYDTVKNEIKKLLASNKPLKSPYFFFHALLLARPNTFGSLLIEYIRSIDEQIFREQITEFYDIFNSFIMLSEKYFQTENNREAIRLLANILFFNSREIHVPLKVLDDMISVYTVLADLDYYWANIYYGCQRETTTRLPEHINNVNQKSMFSNLTKNIINIIKKYPLRREKLEKMNIDAYLATLEDIPENFLKAYFLYIMADINFRYGLINTASALLEELDKYADPNYIFIPHVYLLKANIEEILGNLEKSLEYHEKLVNKKIRWQKFLFDYARALILADKNEEAMNILNMAPKTLYKTILLAYISKRLNKNLPNIERLRELTYCDDPEKAFYLILAMERICNCMYKDALLIATKNNIQIPLLDTIMISCKRHSKNFLKFLETIKEKDSFAYYLGTLSLEEERYEDALKYFKKALSDPSIDKKALYVNMLLAAIMANDSEIADDIANFLEQTIEDHPVIGIAIIHYHLWRKKYSEAFSLLARLREEIDFDAYMHIKKLLSKKKFDTTYYTYFYTSRIRRPIICPLLAVEIP